MAPSGTPKPLTTSEFDAALAGLNTEQRDAVESIEGPVFVIAGPGTGKTQVLTLRIANILVETDTPPEAILALTFTESGAAEMRERLARFIGSRAAKVRFHTFHGFAESLIARYPDSFPRIIGAQVATDAERAEILDDALRNAKNLKHLRPYGDPLFYHPFARNAIQTLKRENVTPEVLAQKIQEAEAEFEAIPDKVHTKGKYEGKMKGEFAGLQKKIEKTRDLLEVYKLYEQGLTELRRYDFEDLILEAVRALTEDDSFRREVQEGLFYILADEHQDANRAQNAILELLVEHSERPNLFIVGDEKQAIYRFQGADLDNVQYFRGRFEGTKVIVLKENYRSTQTILDNALALIEASPDERLSRLPLSAQSSGNKNEKPITLRACETPEDEVAFLTSEIQKLVAEGVPHEDIAILVRRNRDVLWLGERLALRDIPVTMGSEDALNNRFVLALVRFLSMIAEPRDENLAGILNLPGFNISAADAWRIVHQAKLSHSSILNMLKDERLMEEGLVSKEGIEAAKKLRAAIDELTHEASLERPAVVAKDAMRASGILGVVLTASDRSESLAAIRAFLTMFEDLSEREHGALLPRALELVALYHARNIQLPAAAYEATGQVKLMTVHRAKGREFPYVFMPRLTDSAWSTRARAEHFYVPGVLNGSNELEDERRLLYVGLTRAKEHAVLSYALSRDDGRDESPMSLLEDLKPELVEKVMTEGARAAKGAVKTSAASSADSEGELDFLKENKSRKKYNGIAEPTADDFAALREAFFAQGLSPTALDNYLDCPWHYFYVNLLRIPEAQNKFMLYGTAIHEALNSYAQRRMRGEEMGLEYLMSTFERWLSRSALTTRELEELTEKGRRALPVWLQTHQYSWPEKAEPEVSLQIQFELSPGDKNNEPQTMPLKGKLDRIDTLPSGLVRVADYKTGKAKSRNDIMGKTKSSEGNYYRQLTFYKMLLARTEPARTMQEGVIEFVEPDDDGQLRSESFEITDGEVAELEALIRKSAQEILSLSFWNDPCDVETCEWCGMRFGLAGT